MSENIVQKKGSSKGKAKKKSENSNENVVDTATKSLEPIPDYLKCEVSPKKSRKKRGKDQKHESSTPPIDDDGRSINDKEVKIEGPQQMEVDGVCVENKKGKTPEKQNRLLVIKEEADLNTSSLENVSKSVGSKSNSELQTLKKDDGILEMKENNEKKQNKKRRLEDEKEKKVLETVPPEKLIKNEETEIIVRAQNSNEGNVFPTTVETEEKPKKRRKRRNTKQKPGLECASSEQLISDSVELINGTSSNHDNIENQNTTDKKDPSDYEEESRSNTNSKKDVRKISKRKRSADTEIRGVDVISEEVQSKVDGIESTQAIEVVKNDSSNSMSKRRRRNKNKLRNEEQSVTEEEEEVNNKKDKKVEEEKDCKNQMARQVKSEVYEENEENISNDCEIFKKSKRRRRKVIASRSALLIRADSNGTNQTLFQNDIEQEVNENRAAALRRKPSEIYNQKYTGKIQANQCVGLYDRSQNKIEINNEVSSELPISNSDELELSPILKVPSINNLTGYPNSSDSVNQENNVEVHKTYADKVKESSVKIKEESKLVFILRGVDDSKQSFEISMEDQKKCKKSKSKTKQFKPKTPPILESNCESNEGGIDRSDLFSMENVEQKNTKRSTKNIDPILVTSKVENIEPDDKKIPVEDARENDDSLQHAERDKKVKKRRVKKPASEPDNHIIYSHSKLLGTNIEDNTISAPKVGKEKNIVGKESDELDGNINQDDELLLKKPSENNTQQDDSRNKKSKSKKKKRNVSQIETPEISPVNDGTKFQSSSEELTGKSEVDYIVPVESSPSVSQNSTINEEAVSSHSESIETPKNVEKDERTRGKLKKNKQVKNEIDKEKIEIQNSNKKPVPLTDSTDNNQPACLFNKAAVSPQNYHNSESGKRDSIVPASSQCKTTKYGNSSKTVHHLNPLEVPKYDFFAISEAEKRFAKLLDKEHNNNDSSKASNNNHSSNVVATESEKFTNSQHLDFLEIPKYDLFAISDAEQRFAKLLESVHNVSNENNNCYNVLTTELDNYSTNYNYTKTTDELHVNRSEDEFGEIPDGTSKIVNPDLQTGFSDNFSSRPTTASFSCNKKSSAQKMCSGILSWSQVAAKEARTKSDDLLDHASENQHKNKQKSLEFSKPVSIRVCDRVPSRVNISLAEDSEGFVKYVSKREMRKQRSRTSSRSDDEDMSQAVESIQNEASNNVDKKSDEEGMISDSNGSDSIEPSEGNTDRITLDSVWINENSERKVNYSERLSEGIETSASDTDDNCGSRSSETRRQRKKSKSIIFESTVIVHTNTSSHSMGIDIKPPSSASDTDDDNSGSRSSSEARSTSSRKRRKSRGKKRNLDDGSSGGTDLRARPESTCILDGQPMHLDSDNGATASGESNNTIPEDNTDKIENDESPEESNDTICNQKPNSPRIKELFVMIFMELYLLLIYYATGLGKKKPE